MKTYIDHNGDEWTITQSNTYLTQDLYADLVEALAIARALQAERDHLAAAHKAKTAEWIDEFTENQAVIRAWKDRCAEAEAERDELIRWQAEAVEVLRAWDQVADLVPGSFLVLGARRSACVHAYIDHLQAENRALHRGLSEAE